MVPQHATRPPTNTKPAAANAPGRRLGTRRAHQRRIQHPSIPPPIQRRRPPSIPRGTPPSRNQQPLHPSHLPMKVTRIQRNPPNDLVNPPQLSHSELRTAKLSTKRRVLQLGPSPLHAIGQDPRMVKRQRTNLSHRHPRRGSSISPSHRHRQVSSQRQVGHGHHSHPRIPPRLPIGPKLLQVQPRHPSLLTKLPNGGSIHGFVNLHEPARQRPPPPIRRLPSPNQQRTQRLGSHGQHHEIDRDRKGREITWRVHTPEYRLIVRSTTSGETSVRRAAGRPSPTPDRGDTPWPTSAPTPDSGT